MLAAIIPIAGAAERMRVIGFLSPFPDPPAEELRKGVLDPLRKLGWVEGRDFVVVHRYASGSAETLRRFAQELAKRDSDVIVSVGTEATLAAKNATTSIPIVMFMVGDPVGTGIVRSLSRPGGNVTGYSLAQPELHAKRASLLRELLPGVKSVGVLFNPGNPYFAQARPGMDASFRALGIDAVYAEVATEAQIPSAVGDLARRQVKALVLLSDPVLNDHPAIVIEAAHTYALPTMTDGQEVVEAGGLIFYGSIVEDQVGRVVAIVDRILRGARPSEIPVEQPTRFELIVNAGAARKLGLTIPPSILLRADKVLDRP